MLDNQNVEGELAKDAVEIFMTLDAEVQQEFIDLLRFLAWTE